MVIVVILLKAPVQLVDAISFGCCRNCSCIPIIKLHNFNIQFHTFHHHTIKSYILIFRFEILFFLYFCFRYFYFQSWKYIFKLNFYGYSFGCRSLIALTNYLKSAIYFLGDFRLGTLSHRGISMESFQVKCSCILLWDLLEFDGCNWCLWIKCLMF